MYLINVPILNRRPGDIISQGDKNYLVFEAWGQNKDVKGGVLICQTYKPKGEAVADSEETSEIDVPNTSSGDEHINTSVPSDVVSDKRPRKKAKGKK